MHFARSAAGRLHRGRPLSPHARRSSPLLRSARRRRKELLSSPPAAIVGNHRRKASSSHSCFRARPPPAARLKCRRPSVWSLCRPPWPAPPPPLLPVTLLRLPQVGWGLNLDSPRFHPASWIKLHRPAASQLHPQPHCLLTFLPSPSPPTGPPQARAFGYAVHPRLCRSSPCRQRRAAYGSTVLRAQQPLTTSLHVGAAALAQGAGPPHRNGSTAAPPLPSSHSRLSCTRLCHHLHRSLTPSRPLVQARSPSCSSPPLMQLPMPPSAA